MRKEKSKKDRILDVALKEFGEKGYIAASTNEIAGRAGVSKGLIFYQFNSKKELYLAVVERCVEELKKSLDALSPSPEAGFREAVIKTGQSRTIFFSSHPLHLGVLDEASNRPPKELASELSKLSETAFQSALLREKFSAVAVKDESTRDRAFELVMMTLDYLQNKYARRTVDDPLGYSSFADLGREVREYIELIIDGVGAPETDPVD